MEKKEKNFLETDMAVCLYEFSIATSATSVNVLRFKEIKFSNYSKNTRFTQLNDINNFYTISNFFYFSA